MYHLLIQDLDVLSLANSITEVVDLGGELAATNICLPLLAQRLEAIGPIALRDHLHTMAIGLTSSGVAPSETVE